MRTVIDALLEANDAVCTREQLLTVVTRNQFDDEVRRGQLSRLAPRTYSRPWDADLIAIRELAAQRSVGPDAALSHTTALARWGLPVPTGQRAIHVTTPARRRIARAVSPSDPEALGVIVHRSQRPVPTRVVGAARVVAPAWAVVTCWPLLTGAAGRAPAIVAVRERLTTVAQLRVLTDSSRRLQGRAGLICLLNLIDAGCESELELWGYTQVFDVAELRGAARQRTVVVAGRRYRLDLAYERERVAVELDGRGFHASAAQWERDIARDLALATIGWQTVRLSHRRLTTDAAGCRRDVLAVLEQRRRSSAVEGARAGGGRRVGPADAPVSHRHVR